MKLDSETREMAFMLHNMKCAKCEENGRDTIEYATEVHHLLSKTKTNVRLYPLFIDSIFNLQPVCYDCHHHKRVDRIYPHQAELYERYLEKFKNNT